MSRVQAILGQLVVLPIRAYRMLLSPLLPRACRFEPTCSTYAIQAVTVHGTRHGGWLALRRILRCHPWAEAGVDQVPAGSR